MFEQRIGGLEGSRRVAGVDGVEVPVFEPFAEELGLCPARFVQRRIVVALGEVV